MSGPGSGQASAPEPAGRDTTDALDTAGPEAASPDAPGSGERQPGGGGRTGRFWSARRVPAAVVALVLLGCTGLLLYDVAAVRAGRPAMAWRRWLADELATRHLDDVWVLGAAALAVALGIWLLVLAATPGLRAVLPMRRTAGVRAGLDRPAAALVLRDRAMEVSGVQSVRVAVGRRRARARAVAHFRELDAVRGDLTTALGEGLRELHLTHPPRLRVDVRRPKRR
ncbi:hypothetical protein ADL22_13580 [Streptomyces sp. NRRL F-4489]|uniref:DUF6286 domain-containing protein n=1 Tax=Streptomyces sp. NRRL F-4489 TaxID=1609095 RepID=UPI0007495EF6|nr:DUF6286 domain-containing protein [Streptomyces sp. NRRL F-4489]KUL43103.1 hypothetical protein ADL22_13580 [Streptomyces sp. NRRL F-4489]